MFERGEELTGNIRFFLPYLVEKSGLKIDAVYATHVRWDVPAGKMCIIDGPAMAGALVLLSVSGAGEAMLPVPTWQESS